MATPTYQDLGYGSQADMTRFYNPNAPSSVRVTGNTEQGQPVYSQIAGSAPVASPFAPAGTPPTKGLATQPVVTAQAAQADAAKRLKIFQDIQSQVKNQQSVLAQQAAQSAADSANKEYQDAQAKVQQIQLQQKQQEIDAKNRALGAADGGAPASPVSGETTPPATTPEGVNPPGNAPAGGQTQPSSADISNKGIQSATSQFANGLGNIQDQKDQLAEQMQSQIRGLMNGTIPLSPPQQALVTSLQNQLYQHVQEQQVANASYTGQVQQSQFRAGGEYTPAQMSGAVANSISFGIAKVQALDNSAAETIAKLEQDFQTQNFNLINKSYDLLTKQLDDKADALRDTYKAVTDAIKDERDFTYKSKQDEIKNMMESAKFSYQQKQDAIENAYKRGVLTETQRHNMAMEAVQKEPTAKEKKDAADALKNTKASIPIMQDKIAAIDNLKVSPGLNSRVGTSILSRTPQGFWGTVGKASTVVGAPGLLEDAADKISGSGQDFSAGVHKMTNGLTLQNLIDAKAQGATFGALSEGELQLLASSASKINDWELKDSKGNGTGVWNIDEKSFKTELDNIQNLTRRALVLSNESLMSPDEDQLLNQTFGSSGTQALDPSLYY